MTAMARTYREYYYRLCDRRFCVYFFFVNFFCFYFLVFNHSYYITLQEDLLVLFFPSPFVYRWGTSQLQGNRSLHRATRVY